MSQNLDFAYDEYLKSHTEQALSSISSFKSRLKGSSFKYGRFTIPTFFKPYFLTSKQQHLLKRLTNSLHQVLNTTIRFYFEEKYLSRFFNLSKELEDLISIDPGYSESVVFSRFDGILEGESLKITDFACDAPAGSAYADILEEHMLSDELFENFYKTNALEKNRRVEEVLNTLLQTYEDFGGYETPNIAIMDWKHVRTRSEFDFMKKIFEGRGYKTVIVDPRDLKFKGGKLYSKDFRVDIIYRRCLVSEVVERLDDVQDLIRAYRERAVCLVNPLRSCLASDPAVMAILTNREFDHFFTETENEIKQKHLPWTRKIADAEDFFGHQKLYLIDFLKDEKESIVLKPHKVSATRKINIGCDVHDDVWNEAIDKALKENWTIQEYIPVPIMTVPIEMNGKLDFQYKKFNFSSLCFNGKYAGGFSRMSDDSVIRVAEKGGLIPAFWSDQLPDRYEG